MNTNTTNVNIVTLLSSTVSHNPDDKLCMREKLSMKKLEYMHSDLFIFKINYKSQTER